jgi:peroxiredoxin
MRRAPARLLLLTAALAAPAYLAFDALGILPVAWRDRPWPLGLGAVLLALGVLLGTAPSRRLRAAAIFVLLGSPGALAWAAHARYRLPAASATLGVGQPLPALTLPDESGHAVDLRARDPRPLLLVFFRGSWCPYCKQQLSQIAAERARFSDGDLRVMAVSPDPPEPLLAMKAQLALPFPLLSDPERQLVNRCELSHCVAVLDSSGVMRWGVLSGNWERDLPARALLQAAYRAR